MNAETPSENEPPRSPIVLRPGEGREYAMGTIAAVFKADGDETHGKYSISEWWLDPKTKGPGAHSHPEDDVFYVLEGIMSFLVGEQWVHAERGSFVLVPGGITHDFENRGSARAGVLNLSIPGAFEPHMPGIAEWFREHPPGSTDHCANDSTNDTVNHLVAESPVTGRDAIRLRFQGLPIPGGS